MSRFLSPAGIARRAGVTVRTLHHYENLGLLAPPRSEAGHRRYRESDVAQLLRIVWLRRLGFALERIGALLCADAAGLQAALREQRAVLEAELADAASRLRGLDVALLNILDWSPAMRLQDQNLPEPDPESAPFADEAEQRWGASPQWRTSESRRKARGPADAAAMKAEEAGILADWAVVMRQGEAADSAAARSHAERHREHIHRWHYPCSREMHAQMARLYETDERFAAHFDAVAPGLAAYVVAAIRANDQ
ncbi:MerR family transcriptional regulator [Roseateles sp.]|uniref:MerR family transcriptional regulator n=1 Tax=Roseateles sp. TaxID=1971397 RepID=UPI0025FD0677|nr:MerR family transcriptional regulator [Roseateles sp.]MBV8037495.1 MerR family transcriptional regulator [Roseateles sp.]